MKIRDSVRLHESVISNMDAVKPRRRAGKKTVSRNSPVKTITANSKALSVAKARCKDNQKVFIDQEGAVWLINRSIVNALKGRA